jgi:hypothetical protein
VAGQKKKQKIHRIHVNFIFEIGIFSNLDNTKRESSYRTYLSK